MNKKITPNPTDSPSLIHGLLIKAMQRIGAIDKSHTNEFHHYAYRSIDDFNNTLHPIFAELGIFLIPTLVDVKILPTEPQDKKPIRVFLTIDFKFTAADGSSITARAFGEGLDNTDRATSKAYSNALKNALIQVFLIPTQNPHIATVEADMNIKPLNNVFFSPDPEENANALRLDKMIKRIANRSGDSYQKVLMSLTQSKDGEKYAKTVHDFFISKGIDAERHKHAIEYLKKTIAIAEDIVKGKK